MKREIECLRFRQVYYYVISLSLLLETRNLLCCYSYVFNERIITRQFMSDSFEKKKKKIIILKKYKCLALKFQFSISRWTISLYKQFLLNLAVSLNFQYSQNSILHLECKIQNRFPSKPSKIPHKKNLKRLSKCFLNWQLKKKKYQISYKN